MAEKSSTGAVWTKYDSAPYLLTTDYTGGGLNKSGASDGTIAVKSFYYPLHNDGDQSPDFVLADLDRFTINDVDYCFDDALRTEKLTLADGDKIAYQLTLDSISAKQSMTLLYF
jgi:hypothetical protein